MPTVSQTLDLAADRIARLGLWQGGDRGEGTCVANAIVDSTDSFAESQLARSVVAEYLGLENDLTAIFVWNDAEGRTQAEAVYMLRCASAMAAARESEAAKVGASA